MPTTRTYPPIARAGDQPVDPADQALAWAAARGIDVRRWPDPAAPIVDHLVRQPVLHVVEPEADPPRVGELQDWVRRPLDPDEVYARADRLLTRARRSGPVRLAVDPDGVLAVDDRLVILSPTQTALASLLVSRLGEVVAREELVAHLWPDRARDLRLLDKPLGSLRRRLHGLPLRLHAVRHRGILLATTPTVPSPAPSPWPGGAGTVP